MTKLSSICDAIVGRIESGALREGDRLPSEAQLAVAHGVSVGTVQNALARLARSGLVSREHGRGTFVRGARLAPADVRYLRFRDTDGRELPHFIHVRSVKRAKARGPWSDFLGAEGLIRIERRIDVGGRLELWSEFWLGEGDFLRLGGVDRRALEKNLRVLLGQQLSLPTLRVDQWIRFELLPPVAARRLGIAHDAPGFVMELRGYTLRDRPLYWQRVCSGPFAESLVVLR